MGYPVSRLTRTVWNKGKVGDGVTRDGKAPPWSIYFYNKPMTAMNVANSLDVRLSGDDERKVASFVQRARC